MSAIRESFSDVPEEVIAMASGMAVGAGRVWLRVWCPSTEVFWLSACSLAAPSRKDRLTRKSIKCMELTHELHDWFKGANGKNAICCRVLTKEFNMGQGGTKSSVFSLPVLCAWKMAQIVCRELGIKNLDEVDEPAPRRTIAEI